jgi:hypothetical protein
MAAALPFIAIAAAGVSAIGAIQQGHAAAQAAAFNAQVASNNAKIATQNAAYAGAEGEARVQQSGMKTRALIGSEMANQGASGLDVNSGSASQVRESTETLGNLNALTVRSQAAQHAYGYQTQAVNDRAQSELDNYESSSAETGSYLKAGSTVLGAAASPAFNDWLKGGSLDPTSSIYDETVNA